MELLEVKDKRTEKLFLKVPDIIYRNDKNWIPHLKQDIQKVFDPKKNRLLAEGSAIRWVLLKNNQLIGRIAAFVNPKTAHTTSLPTGGMGFFECIDDQDAADKLLNASKNWLLEKGMEAVDGPINFGDRNQFWGCLIENFHDMNVYGMNYNPPYYPRLLESFGFREYFQQICYKRDVYLPSQPIFVRKYNQMMVDPNYRISNIKGRDLNEIAEEFREVYNGGWGGHAGFKEMSKEAARKTMKALKPILDPEIILFAYYQNKPIGFYVNIPQLNEIFRFVHGNLNVWGKLIFLYHKMRRTPKTMVGVVFGVTREYHGKGIEGAMIKYAEDNIVSLHRYYETILTWIGDFNPKMIRVAETLGAIPYRKLATYRLLFDPNMPFERCPIVE